MSAQPVDPLLPGQVHRVPRTVAGIREWLPEGQRAEFLEEVLAAKEEDEYQNVMDGWWAEAHFAQIPDREERRAEAIAEMRAGKKTSLDELRARWRLRSDAAE
ncbi:hypothetical protein HUT06_29900 [Actinomadura sp. NAK00032]|uniref:hypothetical protein n=1 Tax=Actinomadura sp. NAK00032 TaxID=2742128 RepID=UPI0015912F9C|nr:hypothetical protein [Actinomadura sp. NAK00032]QKW37705.1 hypothetical protein HUT06_29900 [Actinomadura sp. NAK00032]